MLERLDYRHDDRCVDGFRKYWYEYCLMDLTKSSRLYISAMHYHSSNKVLIKCVLTIVQIYHLEYLNLLLDVDTLRIQSTKFDDQMTFSNGINQIYVIILFAAFAEIF